MKKMKVAIIDSGVYEEHPALKGYEINGVTCFEDDIIPACTDEYGHGTAVFHIIKKESQSDADIINIKIPNIEEGIDLSLLCKALKYAASLNCNIINLSLGITICDSLDEFDALIKELSNQNIIIVSAFSNDGSFSYPAVFDHVIGVSNDNSIYLNQEIKYVNDSIINVLAKGNMQRLAWKNPDYLMLSGTSFACAHVTALLTHMNTENMNLKTAHAYLKEKATEIVNVKNQEKVKTHFTIQNAAIFPFNKEMHSLLRYQHLLSFKIQSVYDTKYSGTIGATVSHLLKTNQLKKDFKIQSVESFDFDSIDTIILGHTGELSGRINMKSILDTIIHEAMEKNINIYTFDDLSEYCSSEDDRIYYPKIEEKHLPSNRKGMLYRYSKPIVGVFGTSSKQGKFTLQLELRKRLQDLGYSIGQLGTEPNSLLFDMDYVYPMGYNSSVQVTEYKAVQYLNYIMNQLCVANNDLILVGSQSGTIPYDFGNIGNYPISQYNFLLGTHPDVVILCINPYDDLDYIKRTLRFIESSVECRVIAFVIFPMNLQKGFQGIYGSKVRITEEELKQKRMELEKEFQLPAYCLDISAELDHLVEIIINFFTE